MEKFFLALSTAVNVKPNVLLVVLDTVRAANCSIYGHENETTPGLGELETDAVKFNHAIAPATWTVPSHAAMFTGTYPSEIGVHARNKVLPKSEDTAATRLKENKYRTAIMSSNPFLTEGTDLYRGYDFRHTSGMRRALFEDAFDPARYIKTREHTRGLQKWGELAGELVTPLTDLPKNVLNAIYYKYRTTIKSIDFGEGLDPIGDEGASETIAEFKDWVPSDEPFHACLNFMEAHTPFRYRDRFLPDWATRRDVRQLSQDREDYFTGDVTLDDRKKQLLQGLYDAEIRYLDDALRSVWRYLKENGMWDETLIIITSDHGESLGEEDYIFHHSNLLSEELVHVPLLIKYPKSEHAGETVNETVSLTRIFDTIVDAADVSSGKAQPLRPDMETGLVRSEFICLDPQHSTEEYIEPYDRLDIPSRAVYDERMKYILFDDGLAYIFEDYGEQSSIQNAESVDVQEIPDRIRSFANLDISINETDDFDVAESVESRLEDLGYR